MIKLLAEEMSDYEILKNEETAILIKEHAEEQALSPYDDYDESYAEEERSILEMLKNQ